MKSRDYTVVTGLFDIGRGEWKHYKRTTSQYVAFFRNVLSLQAPMIVFVEPKFVGTVGAIRNNIPYSTKIVETNLEDLYMYRYHDLLFEIQDDPEYAVDHEDPYAPEITKPLYALVTCSKPHLLLKGVEYAETDYLIWLDGGYTHGQIRISDLDWNPQKILAVKDKLSIINIEDVSKIDDDPVQFCKKSLAVINGGFFGGGKPVIKDVVTKYYHMVDYQLKYLRLKQDDQVVWEYLVKTYPKMFNLIEGGWYDAFKLC